METELTTVIRQALYGRIQNISFEENSYYDEDFISKSIASDFVGWYEEKAIESQINFVLKQCKIKAKFWNVIKI